MRYALILAAVTVAVGASVLALLWVRDRLIDRWCDRFDYELRDDDAPRDDSDWPPEQRIIRDDQGHIITRLNGEH